MLSGPVACEFLMFLIMFDDFVVSARVNGMMVVSSWQLSLRLVILLSSFLDPV